MQSLRHAFPVSVPPASSSLKSFRRSAVGHITFPAQCQVQSPEGEGGQEQRAFLQRGGRLDTCQDPLSFLLIKKSLAGTSPFGPTLRFTEASRERKGRGFVLFISTPTRLHKARPAAQQPSLGCFTGELVRTRGPRDAEPHRSEIPQVRPQELYRRRSGSLSLCWTLVFHLH